MTQMQTSICVIAFYYGGDTGPIGSGARISSVSP